ncbi:S8 family serine peptidase [Deinococcus sonorensis]|uniref:S8 family serine peptidase n=2 Tax=Deinococcus sonorensis TaxID=309891 RepID=A0AAU7UFK5_9DEIO
MSRLCLLALTVLALGACGRPTSPPAPLLTPQSVSADADGATLTDRPPPNGTWWSEGVRWWNEGVRWWNEGAVQPAPGNRQALQLIRLDEARALAPHAGAGVVIAVIDTGADASHPLLQGALLPGRDFVDGDHDTSEGQEASGVAYGHGTAVAGVIRQVAPRASILPLRVLGPDGSGRAAQVAQAIRYATDAGAQIINLSVAAPVPNEGVRAALQAAASRGVLIVAACGNDGSDTPLSPARSLDGHNRLGQLGVSVTAVDAAGQLPGWSTRGGEVQAPGVGLETAYPGGRQVSASGSSFAAPVVSGVLALALAEGQEARTLAARLQGGTLLDVPTLFR